MFIMLMRIRCSGIRVDRQMAPHSTVILIVALIPILISLNYNNPSNPILATGMRAHACMFVRAFVCVHECLLTS